VLCVLGGEGPQELNSECDVRFVEPRRQFMRDIEKYRKFQREWIAKRRADFFEGKSCIKCNSTKRLELDHIDRANKVSNSIWSWKESRRLEEIAKCQILCYHCHKEKTGLENSEREPPHKGEKCNLAKLTEADVLEIRRLIDLKYKHKVIAEMFGIARNSVSNIKTRKSWAHI
jgi:5-methylcytosine-specific restriction endonuclease McrA